MSPRQIVMLVKSHLDRLQEVTQPDDFMMITSSICGLTQEANLALSRVLAPEAEGIKSLGSHYCAATDVILKVANNFAASLNTEQHERLKRMITNINGRADTLLNTANSSTVGW
jgi:hypothetical protein